MYEIRNGVDAGVRTLKTLNMELAKLKFGTDRFRIDWSEWVPEYKAYYDFFCAAAELSDSEESASLFGDPQLSAEQRAVRDRLVGLLLSDPSSAASGASAGPRPRAMGKWALCPRPMSASCVRTACASCGNCAGGR